LGAAVAVALWFWQQGAFEEQRDATPPAASLPEPPTEARSPSGSVTLGKPPPELPRGTGGAEAVPPVLEIDSLPEQADLPDAGAASDPASPSESELVPDRAPDRPGASTHRVRRYGRRGLGKGVREEASLLVPAEKNAGAAAMASSPEDGTTSGAKPSDGSPPESAAGTKPVTPGAAPANSAAPKSGPPKSGPPKSECDPPWYIDAKGIKRLKLICM